MEEADEEDDEHLTDEHRGELIGLASGHVWEQNDRGFRRALKS